MHVTAPFSGDIVSDRTSLFAFGFDVSRAGQKVGRIYEKPELVWRRRVLIDLDDSIDVPIQFFLSFGLAITRFTECRGKRVVRKSVSDNLYVEQGSG